MTKIHLGISTCPNDTFAFHGLIERRVDWRGLDFQIELVDVQELNRRLFAGDFDVAKASFHAAFLLSKELGVLPSGSALGFGVGPLLLAADPSTRPSDQFGAGGSPRRALVLCPGEHTTATLLYKIFYPNQGQIRNVVFSEIMPALTNGSAEFGVCIHEGRFTYGQQGLSLVEDLGTVWEQRTEVPLPLGGILARHRLGAELLRTVQNVIHDSLEYGRAHRESTLPTMRQYAQEFDDQVIWAHVDLYVNEWTLDLGKDGTQALSILQEKAVAAGALSKGLPPLIVVGES